MMQNKKVLAIDDDCLQLEILKVGLGDHFNLITAESAPQALEELKTELPDIIIMDVSMPDMDGFELCQHLKNNPKLSYIPVVFLTVSEDTSILVRAFHVGAVDFMIKPINMAELRMRLELHINQSRVKQALLEKNFELNDKIKRLSKALSLHQNLVESRFQERESDFEKNANFFGSVHQTIKKNQETLERFDELLRSQERLIESTKKTLGL